ncbi:MAG: AAA family ATPase [Gammaproteobacteria bacterium]
MSEANDSNRVISGDHPISQSLKSGRADGKPIRHIFDEKHVDALNFAIACGRPLLLTGETGVGKTQLARAAAARLERAFVRYTVDARTEPRDVLYRFDAVKRLADAQIAQSLGKTREELEEELAPEKYLRAGPLWWGFQPTTAPGVEPEQSDGGAFENGVVVLIDEIDKAEGDVPNALLEALGEGSFLPEHRTERVCVGETPPLIVFTSNAEKTFPPAFLRRCLVLEMRLPDNHGPRLKDFLVERGKAHVDLPPSALNTAAELLIEDRIASAGRQRPGLAEYIDLLRIIEQRASGLDEEALRAFIDRVRPHLTQKANAFKPG